MIGSGIFIVSTDIARNVGSAGWLIVVWLISGFLTMAAALSYGELSAMYPKAGGQYVYLREAYGKLWAFLFGWAFFAVIQTGTIAAVGVGFSKFLGYLVPVLSEKYILFKLGFFTLSSAQLVGIAVISGLTYVNTKGVEGGKWIQAIFTFAKIAAIAGLIIFGFFSFKDSSIWQHNWSDAWNAKSISIDSLTGAISHQSLNGPFLVMAVAVAMVGAIFSSDAWNNVTFIAGELKRPERNVGLSLAIGTMVVTLLYVSMNLMYTNVLSISEIASAPDERVALAAALKIFGPVGTSVIAVLVMISTFGCNNGLILSGARVYNTMAKDGVFLPAAKKLNSKGVPSKALWMQCVWACVLCLSGTYGKLLDYIVITVLIFYILTIGGIFVLRKKKPDMPRPYKAFGYPAIPVLYIAIAAFICVVLLKEKFSTTWPGIFIIILGVPVYKIFESRLVADEESA